MFLVACISVVLSRHTKPREVSYLMMAAPYLPVLTVKPDKVVYRHWVIINSDLSTANLR